MCNIRYIMLYGFRLFPKNNFCAREAQLRGYINPLILSPGTTTVLSWASLNVSNSMTTSKDQPHPIRVRSPTGTSFPPSSLAEGLQRELQFDNFYVGMF